MTRSEGRRAERIGRAAPNPPSERSYLRRNHVQAVAAGQKGCFSGMRKMPRCIGRHLFLRGTPHFVKVRRGLLVSTFCRSLHLPPGNPGAVPLRELVPRAREADDGNHNAKDHAERDDGLRIHEQHPLPETPPEMQAKHPASHDASRSSRENRSPAARIRRGACAESIRAVILHAVPRTELLMSSRRRPRRRASLENGNCRDVCVSSVTALNSS